MLCIYLVSFHLHRVQLVRRSELVQTSAVPFECQHISMGFLAISHHHSSYQTKVNGQFQRVKSNYHFWDLDQ